MRLFLFGLALVAAKFLYRHQLRLEPVVVSELLREVEEKWVELAVADDKTQMVESCATVARSIVQGSDGDKDRVQEYMDAVCDDSSIKAANDWEHALCQSFAHSLGKSMDGGDAEYNRDSLDTAHFCSGFYATVETAAAARKKERRARDKAAARHAARLKREQAKKDRMAARDAAQKHRTAEKEQVKAVTAQSTAKMAVLRTEATHFLGEARKNVREAAALENKRMEKVKKADEEAKKKEEGKKKEEEAKEEEEEAKKKEEEAKKKVEEEAKKKEEEAKKKAEEEAKKKEVALKEVVKKEVPTKVELKVNKKKEVKAEGKEKEKKTETKTEANKETKVIKKVEENVEKKTEAKVTKKVEEKVGKKTEAKATKKEEKKGEEKVVKKVA